MSWGGEREAAQLAGLLKGAPGSLFLALVLYGEPSTTQQLQMASRYSTKTAREGLAKLEFLGLVDYDRSRHVWRLVPESRLLKHLRIVLCDPGRTGMEGIALPASSAFDSYATSGEYMPTRVKNRDLGAEFPVQAYATATTKEDPDPDQGISVVNSTERARAKKSPSPSLSAEQQEVAHWLIRGGIGRNSPKMKQLLSMELDPEHVKAHVLEKLAWQEGLEEEERPFKTGLLIRKLEDGDEAPALRCETCLKRPNAQGWCRCDYDALIKR